MNSDFYKTRSFFKGSYYLHVSSNQLLFYTLPDITGFGGIEENLNATVKNYGWEFELRSTIVSSKHFRWAASINVSTNHNLLSSGPPTLNAFLERKIGHPLGSFYYYHCLGTNPITGVYQFEDSHGKPTYKPNPATDEISLIDPSTRYFGGLQNTLSYRGIQLDFLFKFLRRPEVREYLFNVIPGTFGSLDGSNQPVDVLSRWTKPGDVSNIERFSQNGSLIPAYTYVNFSDLIYGDGSFIRLDNVSLSWQFPKKWMRNAHLQNGAVFIHAQNVLTLTKYKGLDPGTAIEGPAASTALPPLRVIAVGANVSL